MLDIKYIIWVIWCYLQIKYFLIAFFTTNDSFVFTAATKNFMFLTRFDQDFYTASPWIYLPLFRVPSYPSTLISENTYHTIAFFMVILSYVNKFFRLSNWIWKVHIHFNEDKQLVHSETSCTGTQLDG